MTALFLFSGGNTNSNCDSISLLVAPASSNISIAHLVNPFPAPAGSEFSYVQPITFASMRRAKEQAEGQVEVELLTAQFAADHAILPEGFRPTPDLERSVRDLGYPSAPPFPLIADLLDRLYHHSCAEYLIYTNVDIALQPHFYTSVAEYLRQGHQALIINRRRIPGHYRRVDQLEDMYAEAGKPHPGFDCFIFHRSIYPRFRLGQVCVGIPFIGILTAQNVFAHGENYLLLDREHLTFHIGEDVFKRRNKELFAHNRQEFWKAIGDADSGLWPDLHTRKWPYGDRFLLERLVRWGLHPSLPIRLALKLEWRQLREG